MASFRALLLSGRPPAGNYAPGEHLMMFSTLVALVINFTIPEVPFVVLIAVVLTCYAIAFYRIEHEGEIRARHETSSGEVES